MCKRFLFICLLICVQPIYARAQSANAGIEAFNKEMRPFDSLREIINSLDSVTAVAKINALTVWAKEQDNKMLEYQVEFLKVNKWNKLVLDNEYLELVADNIDKAQKKGYTYTAIRGYHTLSMALWGNRQYSSSVEYALKAYGLYKNMSVSEFPLRADNQHSLATKYYSFKDYDRAKQLLLELRKADSKDLYIILGGSMYNTLALTYFKLKQYDSALHAFNTMYNNEMLNKDYGLAAMAAGNMGQVYYELKDYDNAIKWLQTEYDISETRKKGHINLNIAKSNILLAELYTIKKMPEKAEVSLGNARMYFALSGDIPFNTFREYYLTYARLLATQNQMHQAYIYLDSSRIFGDSARAEFDKGQLVETEMKIDRINHDLQLRELQYSRETSVFIRNAAIIVISLLSVIALLIINRSRLRHIQKQALLEKEKEKAEIDLNSAKIQLDQFTKNIHEKNKLIDRFTNEISKLQHKEEDQERDGTLAQLQHLTILTDDEWDEFRVLFEKVHGGFLNRLKEKFPDITPAETRYLALTKLNLSNKEMANVLGTGTTAIRNYKYRLRKKLDLPDEDSFDEIIRNI